MQKLASCLFALSASALLLIVGLQRLHSEIALSYEAAGTIAIAYVLLAFYLRESQ